MAGTETDSGAIVVFYHARQWLPLRATNEAHALSWGRHARRPVVYVNVAFGVPWWLLDRLRIAAVVFDTIFLSMHWSPEYFHRHASKCLPVAELDCPKLALVQDEFYNLEIVVDFLGQIGVTDVLTTCVEASWEAMYGALGLDRIRLRTVLTGYVDDSRLPELPAVPLASRRIDIGYRAWRNPYWLGEHGLQKVRVGAEVKTAALRRGLVVDINNPESQDFLKGGEWFDFLLDCRAVPGVEGGSGVFDPRGEVKRRVDTYLEAHPDASFEEVRDACFAGEDGAVDITSLSPRHLEACMTRTCQLLVEGHYNGVLVPWRHYLPIRTDYSNLDEVLDALADTPRMQQMVECAYQEVVASGRWSYATFIAELESEIIDAAPVRESLTRDHSRWALWLAQRRDRVCWRFAHLEATPGGLRVRAGVLALKARVTQALRRGAYLLGRVLARTRAALRFGPKGGD